MPLAERSNNIAITKLPRITSLQFFIVGLHTYNSLEVIKSGTRALYKALIAPAYNGEG